MKKEIKQYFKSLMVVSIVTVLWMGGLILLLNKKAKELENNNNDE